MSSVASATQRHADIGLAAGAVDQAGGADDLARMLGDAPQGISRDDRPVVTMSSTISTRAPAGMAKPRRSLNTPPSRSTKIALAPSARAVS